ncbi:MAG TPA: PaaI family thioesterase [Actinomycetota bacterium]|nr:PaaI family thioesterase [Actinomycetota bacterium]
MSDRSRWEALASGALNMPANHTLGFEIVPTEDPKIDIAYRWTVPPEYCNTAGNLQGGVMAAFADALLGGAAAAHLPEEEFPALAEMKLSIFRPAPAGTKLYGTGRMLKIGRRVLFAEAEIIDDEGRLIAKASGTEIPARG